MTVESSNAAARSAVASREPASRGVARPWHRGERRNPPVRWLLGAKLIGSLRKIVVSAMFGSTFDLRDWMRSEVIDWRGRGGEEYWFDFIADCGDGEQSMRDLAGALGATSLEIGGVSLPRGDFLFVGGDTAYYVADWMTLEERFCAPFRGAHAGGDEVAFLGIPGNHDYYDMLDGFNRLYCVQPEEDPRLGASVPPVPGEVRRLALPGYRRVQNASYAIVHLPHDWWFWGLDTGNSERGHVNFRQRREILASCGGVPPDKLIVATPSPSVVHGRYEGDANGLREVFEKLNLQVDAGGRPVRRDGQALLELSGDVHHYARYGGSAWDGEHEPAPVAHASIVAGLGGAFHHPTCSVFDPDRAPASRYPDPETSFRAVARQLLDPMSVAKAGFAWLVAGVIATLLLVTALGSPHLRAVVAATLSAAGMIVHGRGSCTDLADAGPLSSFGLAGAAVLHLALIGYAATWPRRRHERMKKGGAPARYTSPRWICRNWNALVALIAAMAAPWVAAMLLPLAAVRIVVPDFVFLFAATMLLIAIVYLGAGVGAQRRATRVKVGFGALGAFHAVLQIVPAWVLAILLVGGEAPRVGLVLLGQVVLLAGLSAIAMRLARRPRLRWLHLGLWIAAGVAWIGLPLALVGEVRLPEGFGPTAAAALAAFVLGAFGSVYWLGWYLVVSLGFSGHINEAAAAARVDQFRQFIRLRLRKNDVTGYVIAVEPGGARGPTLRLVDVFSVGRRPT